MNWFKNKVRAWLDIVETRHLFTGLHEESSINHEVGMVTMSDYLVLEQKLDAICSLLGIEVVETGSGEAVIGSIEDSDRIKDMKDYVEKIMAVQTNSHEKILRLVRKYKDASEA